MTKPGRPPAVGTDRPTDGRLADGGGVSSTTDAKKCAFRRTDENGAAGVRTFAPSRTPAIPEFHPDIRHPDKFPGLWLTLSY